MIRAWTNKGEEVPLPAGVAVIGICSSDGKPARLLMMAGERIVVLEPKDALFQEFCKAAKTDSAEVIKITG